MTREVEVFITLLAVGFLLLGMEVFLPGGIIGMFGAMFLIGAMIAGFTAFEGQGGWVASGLMIVLGGIGLVAWIRLFPRTPMGRRLTLAKDGRDVKSTPPAEAKRLTGLSGTAESDLRPGGVARIGGQRTDVVSESGYVDAGTEVTVVRVEGSRVVVRAQQRKP